MKGNIVSNLIERSLWTAGQTFLAVLVAAGADYINVATWKAAAIAAGAAGLSALKTAIQERRANVDA